MSARCSARPARLAAACLSAAVLTACSSLDLVDDGRRELRQRIQRLDAIVQAERSDQWRDALTEVCVEAPIGLLMRHFGGDLSPLAPLCGWRVQPLPLAPAVHLPLEPWAQDAR